MVIQWFPGHMTKSMRMMEESVKLCDGIVYVLDSRAAFACINSNLLNIFSGKPILFVLNKAVINILLVSNYVLERNA